MVEQPNPENDPLPLSQDQMKSALKGLETIITRIEELGTNFPEKERTIYLQMLFHLPTMKGILAARNIREDDDQEILIEKLKSLAEELERESARQITPAIEPEIPKIIPSVPDEVRDKVMNTQQDLNTLYEERDFAIAEIPKITEALARLEVFAAGINKKENVEVVRTPDGSVEVIFESDVVEAETFAREAEDIRDSRERIAVYEAEKEEKEKNENRGPVKEFFLGKQENSPEVVKLENKIMRTNEELSIKVRAQEGRSARLQVRLKNKRDALDTPLTITGTDSFQGEWGTLLAKLRDESQTFIQNLEINIAKYDSEIEALEEQRTAVIENKG